ncbi:MAG TPA: L-aspartate oxidase [Mycobacteriales bacterium]|nr:L-aspartate oxidase [Mycobacteriales bacterium]
MIRLPAAAPGWTVRADVVVVGSGVAGLTAALHARRAGRVLLVTKAALDAGSTRWAQGGIAVALGVGDSPEQHRDDTLEAGVGLCDPAAVDVLVREGPHRVRELLGLGAAFDRDPDGSLALTREGGHHRSRVAHAGGDATGAEVSRALVAAVRASDDVEVIEHALVLDVILGREGGAAGVTLHVLGQGSRDGVGAALGRAVVLATGGLGQVYAVTTNPGVSTGDGVALGLRAGAEVADLEFVQFHPTALWLGPQARGQQPLVSEAMRGEGAVLLDASGRRVMSGVHPLEDLAPRDVVTRRMSRVMAETGADHLFLDARRLGAQTLNARFPTIMASCRAAGVDPVTDRIPVAPAAHYASGGLRTDLSGRTGVPGLYACGEVACTGVHGANRLASNSLLEGLVFAARIGDALVADPDGQAGSPPPGAPEPRVVGLVEPRACAELARAMSDGAGVLRSAGSLSATEKTLTVLGERSGVPCDPDAWQATNLHLVARALLAAATAREESRGCHWREDFPNPERTRFGQVRVHVRLDGDGTPRATLGPL